MADDSAYLALDDYRPSDRTEDFPVISEIKESITAARQISILGRKLPPFVGQLLAMLIVLLPVMWNVFYLFEGRGPGAVFDGCAYEDGQQLSRAMCLACNRNSTVVTPGFEGQFGPWSIVGYTASIVFTELAVIRVIMMQQRAVLFMHRGVYVRSTAKDGFTIAYAILCFAAIVLLNYVSVHTRATGTMYLGEYDFCYLSSGIYRKVHATFNSDNPTAPDRSTGTTFGFLQTMAATLLPFAGLFSFIFSHSQEPLAFIRLRQILKRPGLAGAIASQPLYTVLAADLASSANAVSRRRRPHASACASLGKRLLVPDLGYSAYSRVTGEHASVAAEETVAIIADLKARGKLAPVVK